MKTHSMYVLVVLLCVGFTSIAQEKKTETPTPAIHKVAPLPRKGFNQWLADQKGKVVLVNFWATWCPPCREEIPAFVQLQEKLHGGGFRIIGLSLDEEPPDVVQKFYDHYKINYPVFIADMEIASETRWGDLQGIPTSFLFDRNGKIIKKIEGAIEKEELEKLVAPLLK